VLIFDVNDILKEVEVVNIQIFIILPRLKIYSMVNSDSSKDAISLIFNDFMTAKNSVSNVIQIVSCTMKNMFSIKLLVKSNVSK
jgi:hypothetical protein